MSEGRDMRIAVIGAGIVGASCAFFLQRDGHSVTLVDPREPGTATSLGNAGVISIGSVVPIATPGVLRRVPRMLMDPTSPLTLRWTYLPRLLPWLARFVLASRPGRAEELSKAIAALVDRSDQAHDILIQQCGLADLVRSGGWLKVAYSRETLDRAMAFDLELLARRGRKVEFVGEKEIRDLEPALSPEVKAGFLLPQNRAVRHPQRYVEGIVRTFKERGGETRKAAAQDLRFADGRVSAVVTNQGELPVDAVVLAAGVLSRRLAGVAGTWVPLEAERGYHVMLPHPDTTLTRPVYTIDHAFVMAPMEHGIRITGGVELASPEAPPDYRAIRRLVPLARRVLPGLPDRILSDWQGNRPSLPDSLPVIGRAPRHANLYLAFGHHHIGLTLGPMTGRVIADLVAGRDPGLDLTPYRADRRFF
jgi:D-amino-acid dehydrogenase